MSASGWLLPQRHPAVLPSEVERSLVYSFFNGEKGVFVEVGAFDPIFQSQSYHLEMAGWVGVLVEPVPELAEELRKSRSAKVYEVACVGPEASGRSASFLSLRGLSTLHFDPETDRNGTVIEVSTTTVDDLLAEAGIEHVDFISVDVEGGEPDVLRGLNFKRYAPRLVLVDDRDRFRQTCKVMARNKYRLVRRTGHNAWFVPQNDHFAVGSRGRLHLSWTYGPGRLYRRMRAWMSDRSRQRSR